MEWVIVGFLGGVFVGLVLSHAFSKQTKKVQKEKPHVQAYVLPEGCELLRVGDQWVFKIKNIGFVNTSGSAVFRSVGHISLYCLFDKKADAFNQGMKYCQLQKISRSI